MIEKLINGLNTEEAVYYHYGKFPPIISDYSALIRPISQAAAAVARYDQMLKSMHNSQILLAPLRRQEAVVSSRMEGTVSTLDEVLRYEAEKEGAASASDEKFRSETIEVYLYSKALLHTQRSMKEGQPLSNWLIRSAHGMLLGFGRRANMALGQFKTDQNYLADRSRRKVLFVPISPEKLNDGMDALFNFIQDENVEVLLKTAVAHLEFEAIHPFKDGNGGIGRMLIPLLLWKHGALSEPYFYMSRYFESNRDEYIDCMRNVSSAGNWVPWILFFLRALETEAADNLSRAADIRSLYESLKEIFREKLASQWSQHALDFMFTQPIFANSVFTTKSGIPEATAHRFTRVLTEASLLRTLSPAAGRRPAFYAFEPLLELVRD